MGRSDLKRKNVLKPPQTSPIGPDGDAFESTAKRRGVQSRRRLPEPQHPQQDLQEEESDEDQEELDDDDYEEQQEPFSPEERPRPTFFNTATPQDDSATDPDFLADLVLNPTPHNYELFDVMQRSSRIALQASAVVIFYVAYYNLLNETLQPWVLIRLCYFTSLIAHTVYQFYSNWPVKFSKEQINSTFLFPRDRFKVTFIFFVCCYWLAPVLRTLTTTISTDTVYACAVSLTVIHVFTNDYGIRGFLVSKTISMNAAVIGSIFLASRLEQDTHAIAIITLAVQLFVLFPLFSCVVWDSATALIAAVLFVSYNCALISTNFFLVYIGGVVAITYGFPLVFVLSQQFKYNLYGPWDEAVLVSHWNPDRLLRSPMFASANISHTSSLPQGRRRRRVWGRYNEA